MGTDAAGPQDRGKRGQCRWLTAALLLLATPDALAAGLSVSPVSLQFAPQETVQGLWLRNSGSQPLRAQVRVFAWRQAANEDQLDPSTALIVSPPMLSIEAGQRQFVRIVRPAAAASDREQSYRLLIDELPDPTQPPKPGLNFVMRYSVPVFVGTAPESIAGTAAPQWSLRRDAHPPWTLVTRNPGTHRLQLTDLELLDAEGRSVYRHTGLLGYVLAGGERQWPLSLPASPPSQPLEIKVRLNGQSVRHPLPVEAPERAPR